MKIIEFLDDESIREKGDNLKYTINLIQYNIKKQKINILISIKLAEKEKL